MGSSAGHGFGSGLCPLAPLGGLQARYNGRCRRPLGLFWARVLREPVLPFPRALPGVGDSREAENRCGGEGGWAESAPPPQDRAPSRRASDGGGGGVVRAGVQCGHEGHAQSPRVCVRAWGWPRSPLAQGGPGGRGAEGRGRSGVSFGSRGSWWGRKGGSMAPAPRPECGRFPRPRRGAPHYSMTRQRGKCWEKYLKSSGVAPGQLVSSSSSSSCSCTRPDSPVVVSSGQPVVGGGQGRSSGQP